MADKIGQYWDSVLGPIPARYKDMGDGTYALVASTTPGAGGGGTAQLAVRDAGNTWQDVGYFAGDQSVPVTIVGGAAGGGAAQTQVRNAADTLWDNVGPSAGRSRMPAELYVGTAAVDPRSIRALTSADVVDVSDRSARLVGHVTVDNASLAVTGTFWQATQPVSLAAAVDVSDRAARLVGHVTVDNASIAVTGTFWQATQPVSIAAAVDVSDRAARLVGRVYGSQGQQLTQTATNFNTQVEIAVGGTLIDPRSIRTLTTADAVTATLAAASDGTKLEDAGHVSGDRGMAMLAVRNDLFADMTSTDLDYGTPTLDIKGRQIVREINWLIATTISGANAAVTLTIAAAGAGLFHYITSVEIVNINPTATAIAGSAVTLSYTSTNIPGAPAWTAGNALAAGAEKVVQRIVYAGAIKTTTANTATTIVAPAIGAGGVCRITVTYYTAP